jgi:hypothetical protein
MFPAGTTAARILAGAVVLLGLVLLGRHLRVGFAEIDGAAAQAHAQGQVLRVAGGDVALRDLPRAHEIRRGELFADPYYAHEVSWYPFAMPALVATASRLGDRELPETYFRVEVVMTAIYLAAVAYLAFSVSGWLGLLLLPALVWLGHLAPGNGLYPVQAARGWFCLFLVLAGRIATRAAREEAASAGALLALGLAAGTLALWNGAAFFTALGVVAILAAHSTRRAWLLRRARPPGKALLALAIGVAAPLALLFGPQLAHYHTLRTPEVARAWLDPVYNGGGAGDFLRLALLPRGLPLVLCAAFVLRLVLGRRLHLPTLPALIPLACAFILALLLGHAGFLLVGARGTFAAGVARAVLFAPPHTFQMVADCCLPVVMIAGAHALVAMTARLVQQRAWWAQGARFQVAAPLALRLVTAAAFAVLIVTFPYSIRRQATTETAAFDAFAKQVGAIVADRPLFFRAPGRFVQAVPLKILLLAVEPYANHYVQETRRRAAATLDAAVARGDAATADSVLDAYAIGYIMEDRRGDDTVVQRCGGEALAASSDYVLRRRKPCQP